jgi:hypothetical protein
MPQKVSFLFGSGISIPAGMPCVNQITEKVSSGTGVMRHTDGNYYFGEPLYAHAGIPDEYVPRVVEFLKTLSLEIQQYYSSKRLGNYSKREVNYEDLYYVAQQICDSETGKYDNPIVQAFIDKILPDIEALFIRREDEIMEWTPFRIARQATHYIHCIVREFLKKEPADLDYLHCVRDAFHDLDISSVDLFTVNHDTVIEQYLDQCGIEYTDGFRPPENGVRYWSPKVFEDPSRNARLLKLHGSVNWSLFEPDVVGISIDGRPWLAENLNGQPLDLVDDRPMLLAGTFNKMLQYTSGIYADLYCEFRRALRETELLIVSGYSFGDKGINRQLVEWANSSEQKVMVVIHSKPGGLKKGAGPDIFKKWDSWLQGKRLVLVQSLIQDTSWKHIKDAIHK